MLSVKTIEIMILMMHSSRGSQAYQYCRFCAVYSSLQLQTVPLIGPVPDRGDDTLTGSGWIRRPLDGLGTCLGNTISFAAMLFLAWFRDIIGAPCGEPIQYRFIGRHTMSFAAQTPIR
jgi:hypothetical protein